MIDRRVITDVELNRFVSGSHYVHYMKTAAWGAFKAKTENNRSKYIAIIHTAIDRSSKRRDGL